MSLDNLLVTGNFGFRSFLQLRNCYRCLFGQANGFRILPQAKIGFSLGNQGHGSLKLLIRRDGIFMGLHSSLQPGADLSRTSAQLAGFQQVFNR
ncbi:MAG TPA: hypothetical protein PKW33_10505 [Anaerolineaceae bacterium]|nr:hypothetical protein [Anaerolineaceae bacterium]HPN52008.1 hypothetical protein [Anaerolineaceae bacterium]